MPNKRDRNKRIISAWLQSEDADDLKSRAEQLGMTVTDLIKLLIHEELKRAGYYRRRNDGEEED